MVVKTLFSVLVCGLVADTGRRAEVKRKTE